MPSPHRLRRMALRVVLGGGLFILSVTPTWAAPPAFNRPTEESAPAVVAGYLELFSERGGQRGRAGPHPSSKKRGRDNHYDEWQHMSPEEKEQLRRRMKQWQRMSPQERDLYRHRFQQWQQLSPKERRRLKQKFDQWERLPSHEKDQIRRRFRD